MKELEHLLTEKKPFLGDKVCHERIWGGGLQGIDVDWLMNGSETAWF